MDSIVGAALGIVAVTAMGALAAAVLYYFNRRLGVNVAQDNYTDALEGELAISKDRITRVEAEASVLRKDLELALARAVQLEADIVVVKRENDRLRAENDRLRDLLHELGKENP